jgi:hypothetical protein
MQIGLEESKIMLDNSNFQASLKEHTIYASSSPS